jgi:thymidylate synthase
MNKLDKQYTDLLQDILDNGAKKQDRTGTGTISVFGRQIRHKMSEGFPLLTTKKMPFKTIVTELLWFLRGDTNIKYLVDNNCHIWNGDAYKNYSKLWTERIPTPSGMGDQLKSPNEERIKWGKEVSVWRGDHGNGMLTCEDQPLSQEEFINKIKTDDEFAKKWGELGPIYGAQWRGRLKGYGFNEITGAPLGYGIDPKLDQIQNLINDLKTNPDSRRLMVNAWNVGELDQMVLPPCHYGFQVYTRELSLTERRNLVTLEKYESVYNGGDSRNTLSHSEIDQWGYPTRAISLMWNQRSCDTFLGLPFNIASYGLLLEILAKEVNMVPEELIGNLGDVHLYSNHLDAAKEQIGREFTEEEIIEHLQQSGMDALKNEPRMEYISKLPKRTREPYPLPTFDCPVLDEIPHTTFNELVFKLQPCDFYMEDYVAHPTIKAPLSN